MHIVSLCGHPELVIHGVGRRRYGMLPLARITLAGREGHSRFGVLLVSLCELGHDDFARNVLILATMAAFRYSSEQDRSVATYFAGRLGRRLRIMEAQQTGILDLCIPAARLRAGSSQLSSEQIQFAEASRRLTGIEQWLE